MNWILNKFHNWQVRRRRENQEKLEALHLLYGIFVGKDFWFSSAWFIERMINDSIKRSVPYEFDDEDDFEPVVPHQTKARSEQ